MSYVNFGDLKSKISIVQVLEILGIELKSTGNQLRGTCPIHGGNNPRGFVVTPSKGVWYCFGDCGNGGDLIELYARVKDVSAKDAALAIAKHFGLMGETKEPTPSTARGETLKPLDYLVSDHEALGKLGIAAETLKHFGAGFAPKGIMRGRLAVPLHDTKGVLRAYVGDALTAEQEPRLLFPKDFSPESVIFNAYRATGGVLAVARDPITVLKAHENGVENVVAFLGEIVPAVLERLIELMKEKHIEAIDIF